MRDPLEESTFRGKSMGARAVRSKPNVPASKASRVPYSERPFEVVNPKNQDLGR